MAEQAKKTWDEIGTYEDEAAPVAEPGQIIGEQKVKPLNEYEQAQLDALRINAQRGGMDAKQFQAFLMQRNSVPNVLKRIDRLDKAYRLKLKGPEKGGVLGYGGSRNVKGWLPGAVSPGNARVNNAAQSLMGDLIQLYDTTGGEVNSLAELRARFGPLLPASNDADEVIESKLANLRQMATGQAAVLDTTSRQMGILPPDEGGIPYQGAPVEPDEELDKPDEEAPAGEDKDKPPIVGPGGATTPPTGGGDGGYTTAPPPAFDPRLGEKEIPATDWKMAPIPGREGANSRLTQMLKSGATDDQLTDELRKYRVPENEIPGHLATIKKARAHHKQYGDQYKGQYFDIERAKVPTTGYWEKQAGTGGGAAFMAAADTLTGSHMDNLVAAAGGDAEAANRAMAATREAHPGYAAAGDVMGGLTQYLAGAELLRGLGAGINVLRTPKPIPGAAPIEEALAAGAAPEAAAVTQAERTTIPSMVKDYLGSPQGALAGKAVGGDIAQGVVQGSGQDTTGWFNLDKAAQGGLTAAMAGPLMRAPGNVLGAAVSPTGGTLAPLYEAGVQPSIGQRMAASTNPLAKIGAAAEELFARIPGFGELQALTRQRAVDQMQRGAFNETLGELAPFEKFWTGVSKLPDKMMKGTEVQGRVKSIFNKAYDKARSGMRLRGDPDLDAGLKAVEDEMPFLSPDSARVLGNHVKAFKGILAAGKGTMTGDKYKNFVSKLAARASLQAKKDPELAAQMFSLRQHIDDAARRSSPAEAVELLDAADRGYGKLVVVQNAAERATPKVYGPGEFGGEELTRASKGMDKSKRKTAYATGQAKMEPYATGAEALGSQPPKAISGEGMAQAGVAAGGLAASGTAGALVSPVAAAPLGYYALNTAANAPLARDVVNAIVSPRTVGAARPYLNDIRYAAEMAGKYGGPMLIGIKTHKMPPMEGEPQK